MKVIHILYSKNKLENLDVLQKATSVLSQLVITRQRLVSYIPLTYKLH